MEKDVEQRIKEKYALIDKTDARQLAEAQKAGLTAMNDDMVGDLDGQGFGLGQATKDMKAQRSELVNVTKRNRSRNNQKTT